ncbi:MAG: excinuclease ABC subunit UvrC [Pseudomonadota bacterium]|nr:excinuclease ABC subunit UvrC [Pseudomonadota bacterium]
MSDDFNREEFLKTLASAPGVYQMFNAENTVIYVGKARNLKKRVSNYFSGSEKDPKTKSLVENIAYIIVTITHTENEALLLESSLIKKLHPRYNILLRDDKSYPYLFLSAHPDFPRMDFHRGAKKGKGTYFGPYPSAGSVRETLALLQKLFKVRQCSDSFFSNRSRPCLQYQIQRCTAPCVNYVTPENYQQQVRHAKLFLQGKSEAIINELIAKMKELSKNHDFEVAAKYRDRIGSLRRLQEKQYVVGAKGDIDIIGAVAEMNTVCLQVLSIRGGRLLGGKAYFPHTPPGATVEEVVASFLPQYYLNHVRADSVPSRIVLSCNPPEKEWIEAALAEQLNVKLSIVTNVRMQQARWVNMALTNAQFALTNHLTNRLSFYRRLEALQHTLRLPDLPQRIECFDVSHTRGEATVASCVVFNGEGSLRQAYRRFNIHDVTPGDDYGALTQAIKRRYIRLKKEQQALPDILLIDGGKGQLHVAEKVLEELQVSGVLIMSIAKGVTRKPGMELIYVSGREHTILLSHDSLSMHILQQIRDEAHRFAITAQRGQLAKARNHSPLEHITGVGAKRRRALLQHFGGMQEVRRAGVEELAKVPGISRQLAQLIHDALR